MYWLLGLIVAVVIGMVLWLGVLMAKRDENPLGDHSSRGPERKSGYSVWRYESERWVLEEDRSVPGFAPGRAPTEVGLFEGYCIKVTSVPKQEAS